GVELPSIRDTPGGEGLGSITARVRQVFVQQRNHQVRRSWRESKVGSLRLTGFEILVETQKPSHVQGQSPVHLRAIASFKIPQLLDLNGGISENGDQPKRA